MVGVLYEDDLDLQQSVLRMGEMERGKGKGKYVLGVFVIAFQQGRWRMAIENSMG